MPPIALSGDVLFDMVPLDMLLPDIAPPDMLPLFAGGDIGLPAMPFAWASAGATANIDEATAIARSLECLRIILSICLCLEVSLRGRFDYFGGGIEDGLIACALAVQPGHLTVDRSDLGLSWSLR